MYVKSFAHNGIWKDVSITPEQEEEVKAETRTLHNALMVQCINDAKEVVRKAFPNGEMSHVLHCNVAVALFEKRASHVQFTREKKAKKVFDEMVNK